MRQNQYMKSRIAPDAAASVSRVFKALGHPLRLQIVSGLTSQECNVKRMTDCLGVAQATVSQQLAVLRAAGVLAFERKGNQVCYRVSEPWVRQLVRLVGRAGEKE